MVKAGNPHGPWAGGNIPDVGIVFAGGGFQVGVFEPLLVHEDGYRFITSKECCYIVIFDL